MTDSEAIRADIERTRAELGSDVDAVADKVTPSKVVDREKAKVANAFGSVKDKVMGAASSVTGSGSSDGGGIGGAARGAAQGVGDATKNVAGKASGNPLAVGLIAFGVGALVAGLLPASDKEKRIGASVKDAAQPLVQQAGDIAKDVAGSMKDDARDAAMSVKDTAAGAVDAVKSEASSGADQVKQDASEARHSVQNGS
jgi:uncharacterized protein YjbJ (UPF0337 family)